MRRTMGILSGKKKRVKWKSGPPDLSLIGQTGSIR